MGDKANVFVRQEEDGAGVYLYTHWGGHNLPETVQAALAHKVSWDDPQYLARVIFCHMIGDDVRGDLNYGISARIGDNGHKILVVDATVKGGRVGYAAPPSRRQDPQPSPVLWTSFADFVKLDAAGIKALGWE